MKVTIALEETGLPYEPHKAAFALCRGRFTSASTRSVETLDAQALAETFLGDTIFSNIVALGFAWQRGLVPVGLAALLRAPA